MADTESSSALARSAASDTELRVVLNYANRAYIARRDGEAELLVTIAYELLERRLKQLELHAKKHSAHFGLERLVDRPAECIFEED